jgi:2-oxo-4-hydroxy-4-carboxy-5-ureidoimidazoline decarboxylase
MAALDELNTGTPEALAGALRACNAAPAFAAGLLARRPFPDTAAAVAAAGAVVRALPWDDVLTALAAHPRIGDRVAGSSAEAAASRREQGAVQGADEATRAALLEGNRAYEARFDRVFLVRAAGREPAELLAELHRRLGNDEAAERAEVTEQLAQITGLRVKGLVDG